LGPVRGSQVPLGACQHGRMAPMHMHHACATRAPPGAHRFDEPLVVRPRRGRGWGAVLEPRQPDVRTPIHTLARARPASPLAVLASTQPIIASYNDARCGCDAAGRLRCCGSGAKWARANTAAGGTMCTGARCVAPSPPRHLARTYAGLLRGGEGWRRPAGAFIPCSYYAPWRAQHAARRSAKLYDISDRATPYHFIFILLGVGEMAKPARGRNNQSRGPACCWGCEYFPSQQEWLGCLA
jgi:hypothetical protein